MNTEQRTTNNEQRTKSAITLTEMTVVIAVVALLVGLGLPAVRAFLNSFESQGGAKAMISAVLASARAIAAKEQRYAGIRFQKDLYGNQYMIFIIYDTDIPHLVAGNLGCRAAEGIEPIKLPDTVGVIDISGIADNTDIDEDFELTDTTTFSILFSPSGKLVIHDLWVRNRDGVKDNRSRDDIFNTLTNVRDNQIGMFPQDEDPAADLHRELSRRSFIIYERDKFRQAYEKGQAWSDYLVRLAPEAIYINPYTGTIIRQTDKL